MLKKNIDLLAKWIATSEEYCNVITSYKDFMPSIQNNKTIIYNSSIGYLLGLNILDTDQEVLTKSLFALTQVIFLILEGSKCFIKSKFRKSK